MIEQLPDRMLESLPTDATGEEKQAFRRDATAIVACTVAGFRKIILTIDDDQPTDSTGVQA